MSHPAPTEVFPPSASRRPPADVYKWLLVAMLWCVVFLNYADRQALSGTLPLIREELHLSPHEQGMLGAAFAWVYGLCSPFAGALVDRLRRSRAVVAGLHVWSAICAATAFAPNFGVLLALRGAEGLGETAYFPASVSLIAEYHEETRSRALALHQSGVYVGIVGGTTAAAAIGAGYGWRASFAVFGGAGILLGFILRRALRDKDETSSLGARPSNLEPEAPRGSHGTAERGVRDSRPEFSGAKVTAQVAAALREIARPAPIALLLAFVCANAVASVLFVWLPTYVHDKFHQNLAIAGLSATVFAQLGSLLGALTGGYAADRARTRWRSGRIAVQAIGLAAGVPFVIASGYGRSLTLVAAAFFGWGFAKGIYEANIFASMFDITSPSTRGGVVGLMNMAGWLFGAGTAPIAVGYIAERSSLGVAIASTAVVYVVGAAALVTAAFFLPDDGRLVAGSKLD